MPITFYDVAVPPLIRGLKNLSGFLKKGEEYAKAHGIDAQEYLDGRLYPDMLPLPPQIHRVSDAAKALAVRTAGVENEPMTDDQKTFPELYERIERTIKFLEAIDPKQFDGKESNEVVVKYPNFKVEAHFTALEYVQYIGHPNFWFHVTTAYGILRSKGVEVGKLDFLNGAGLLNYKPIA